MSYLLFFPSAGSSKIIQSSSTLESILCVELLIKRGDTSVLESWEEVEENFFRFPPLRLLSIFSIVPFFFPFDLREMGEIIGVSLLFARARCLIGEDFLFGFAEVTEKPRLDLPLRSKFGVVFLLVLFLSLGGDLTLSLLLFLQDECFLDFERTGGV